MGEAGFGGVGSEHGISVSISRRGARIDAHINLSVIRICSRGMREG